MIMLRRSCVGLIALCAVIVSAGVVHAQRGPRRPEVRGVVKSVDAKAGTITISMFEGRPGEGRPAAVDKTFSLIKDVEVAINNGTFADRRGVFSEGKLADLVEGTMVSLAMTADEKSVESILAEGPLVRGQLKSVDAAKNSLTVALFPTRRDEGGEEKTIVLAANAEIAVDDGLGRRFSQKEGKLADLAAGSSVTIRLSADQKHAVGIVAEGPGYFGLIKAVDAGKNTITIALNPGRGDSDAEEKTLDLAKNAMILLDDGRGRRLSLKEAKLAAVPVGAAVSVRMSVDQKVVTMLRAEGPNVTGLLKSIDAAKGTITVMTRIARVDNPEEKTYSLAKGARIVIDGNEGKLADIKVTDEGPFVMLRLGLDLKTVQAINVGAGRGRE